MASAFARQKIPMTEAIMLERLPGVLIYRMPDAPLDDVLAALRTNGVTMKRSKKNVTRRVGDWVVKESLPDSLRETVKHTVLRQRYRQAWRAAVHLQHCGIPVPAPKAFVEHVRWGIIRGNAFVAQYLEGCRSVEAFAPELADTQRYAAEIHGFLERLANAVNALTGTGACHTDLSGKNILSADGHTFYFIDLDAVELDKPYSREARLRNHVQLYDSFCDWWGDAFLAPFLRRMLPENEDPVEWMRAVRQSQRQRRARTEAILAAREQT